MVASFSEFNHSLAIVAPLPALLFRHLHQALSLVVLWAFPSCVVLAIAQDTYFSAASTTTSVFPSGGQVNTKLAWLDPFTAAFCRAVEILGSRILFKLLVPKSLELIVEQAINVLQWNILFCAACWRHVLRIFNRESEQTFQAWVTHTMTTGELCCLVNRNVIVHTNEAIDPSV